MGVFGAAFSGFLDVGVWMVQQVADTNMAVTRMVIQLRHVGPFDGMAATGKTMALGSMRIDRIENGKDDEHWRVGDLAVLAQQVSDIHS